LEYRVHSYSVLRHHLRTTLKFKIIGREFYAKKSVRASIKVMIYYYFHLNKNFSLGKLLSSWISCKIGQWNR